MNAFTIIMLVIAVVAATMFVIFNKGQHSFLALSLKAISSFSFIVFALSIAYSFGFTVTRLLFILGLIASSFGDIVLALPDMRELKAKSSTITLIGGLCFALAHVFYIISMILLFGFKWWVILIAVGFGLLFYFGNKLVGKLNYGDLAAGMPVYSIFVSFDMSIALMAVIINPSAASITLLVGLILFWFSDIVLMHIYFGGHDEKTNDKLYFPNLGFYYAGQILIALSTFFFI